MRLITSSLLLLAAVAMVSNATADIQDPPAKKYGATRKLARGLGNMAFGMTEVASTMTKANQTDGNSAAFSLGVVVGFERYFERIGMGLFEVATFPFGINKGNYRPYFQSPTRGVNRAFEEFPPELGFDSKYTYSRPLN